MLSLMLILLLLVVSTSVRSGRHLQSVVSEVVLQEVLVLVDVLLAPLFHLVCARLREEAITYQTCFGRCVDEENRDITEPKYIDHQLLLSHVRVSSTADIHFIVTS